MLTRTDRFTTANSVAHFHRHQEVGFIEEPDVIDFSVDDLLDFSGTSEFETEVVAGGIEDGEPCVSVKFTGVSGDSVFPPSEISVPADDVAELEWLSRFVEDSFSEYSQPYTGVHFSEKTMLEPDKIKPAGIYTSHLFPPPMTKPRAKGRRSSGKSWVLIAASDTTSSSCSVSSLKPLSAKRQSRRPPSGARRCSHCGVQRTPQWRAGPGGAKTLCNACGVRFKSGRLCPEYRPACSPTFSSELHSNQHRKVVEMRRRKMVGLAPTVCNWSRDW